jgi:Protein of unknown function (DUF2637)
MSDSSDHLDHSSGHVPTAGRPPASAHRGLRLLALCAVTLGLLGLAAAAFVLSYAGVHVVALAAGISPRWARIYPLILDAMVVVAGAAVLSLRGAGLPSRWYAWLSLLVMLAADAGADTVHAVGTKLPHKQTAAAAAIIPWALVLIGFGLLLTMLRHGRLRADSRRSAKPATPTEPAPQLTLATETIALPQRAAAAEAQAEPEVEPELDVEPDEPEFDEPEAAVEPQAETETEFEPEEHGEPEVWAETEPDTGEGPQAGAAAPHFQRVRSTPVPPEG